MKRMGKAMLFAGALTMALPLAGVAADSPQKPGKWQITMEMEMTGMPMKMPPQVITKCVTAQDVKDPDKAVPKSQKGTCKVSDYKVEGNKVSWSVKCEGDNPSTGKGEITYAADSYEGWMKISVMGPNNEKQDMTMKYHGKRLGDCDK